MIFAVKPKSLKLFQRAQMRRRKMKVRKISIQCLAIHALTCDIGNTESTEDPTPKKVPDSTTSDGRKVYDLRSKGKKPRVVYVTPLAPHKRKKGRHGKGKKGKHTKAKSKPLVVEEEDIKPVFTMKPLEPPSQPLEVEEEAEIEITAKVPMVNSDGSISWVEKTFRLPNYTKLVRSF
jgi:hypothetical protein